MITPYQPSEEYEVVVERLEEVPELPKVGVELPETVVLEVAPKEIPIPAAGAAAKVDVTREVPFAETKLEEVLEVIPTTVEVTKEGVHTLPITMCSVSIDLKCIILYYAIIRMLHIASVYDIFCIFIYFHHRHYQV